MVFKMIIKKTAVGNKNEAFIESDFHKGLNIISSDNKKQSLIFNFLKGYFSSVLEKISILKTNKSKACSLQSFYYSLENYKSCMNEENINYYTNLYNTSIKNYLEIAVY